VAARSKSYRPGRRGISAATMQNISSATRSTGSTPTEEEISISARVYEESDQRTFEIRCYHCAHWFEPDWSHVQWPEGKPDQASAFCPGCGASLEERRKSELVEGGRWRAHPVLQGTAVVPPSDYRV
jgi:phage terminase large subunit GpA-like protein